MLLLVAGYAKDNPNLHAGVRSIFLHSTGCSYLELANNRYHDNFAQNGGAILYASNNTTINMTCDEDQAQLMAGSFDCGEPMWTNNTVGEFGYGPLIAFPPATLQSTLPSSVLYVSNGAAKLPMSIQAADVQGSQVRKGWPAHCWVCFQVAVLVMQLTVTHYLHIMHINGNSAQACSTHIQKLRHVLV